MFYALTLEPEGIERVEGGLVPLPGGRPYFFKPSSKRFRNHRNCGFSASAPALILEPDFEAKFGVRRRSSHE